MRSLATSPPCDRYPPHAPRSGREPRPRSRLRPLLWRRRGDARRPARRHEEERYRRATLAGVLAFRLLLTYFVAFFSRGYGVHAWTLFADPFWQPFTVWFGAHFLHLKITTFSNRSADTTYDYVRVVACAAVAVAASLVWTALDRTRADRGVRAAARLGLRYVVVLNMLSYGAGKVFKLQFPDLSYVDTLQPFGEQSPMSLLWSFMGFSAGYTIFGGVMEVVGGVLLLFRRTATLGALVVIAVMTNVVMLNLCYDVPVKILSSHLLFAACLLAAPDAKRLAGLLVFNRAPAPVDLGPTFPPGRAGRAMLLVAKVAVIAWMTYATLGRCLLRRREWSVPLAPPQGTYEVTSFARDGKDAPDDPADKPRRWRLFTLKRGYVRVWFADLTSDLFKVDGDAGGGTLTLLTVDDHDEPVKGAPPAGEIRLSATPAG